MQYFQIKHTFTFPICDCRLKANEQRRSELFAKQGRGQQFPSVKDRDTWLKKVSRAQLLVKMLKKKVESENVFSLHTPGGQDSEYFH